MTAGSREWMDAAPDGSRRSCVQPGRRRGGAWVRASSACSAAPAPTVFEVHPEVAFWRLNGTRPLDEPKKIKGVPYAPGLALRRALLVGAGFAPSCVEAVPPKGARPDDLLDALACAAIARC